MFMFPPIIGSFLLAVDDTTMGRGRGRGHGAHREDHDPSQGEQQPRHFVEDAHAQQRRDVPSRVGVEQ